MAYVPAAERYDRRTYNRCGRSGLLLPAVSLGLWNNFGGDRPLESSRAIVRRAFDLGITHFDLANNYGPPYGSAEENFGTLMEQDLRPYRDELIVSTKAGYDMWPGPYGDIGFSPLAQGMLTDKYLHGIPEGSRAARPSSLSPELISGDALAKVRALGAIAARRGQSLAQMALAWTLRDPRVTSTLAGASSVAQLEQNVGAIDKLPFSPDELAEIDRHATDSGIDLWAASSRE